MYVCRLRIYTALSFVPTEPLTASSISTFQTESLYWQSHATTQQIAASSDFASCAIRTIIP
eukprot:10733770-Ditylum_brightwellii.AAC.2